MVYYKISQKKNSNCISSPGLDEFTGSCKKKFDLAILWICVLNLFIQRAKYGFRRETCGESRTETSEAQVLFLVLPQMDHLIFGKSVNLPKSQSIISKIRKLATYDRKTFKIMQ